MSRMNIVSVNELTKNDSNNGQESPDSSHPLSDEGTAITLTELMLETQERRKVTIDDELYVF